MIRHNRFGRVKMRIEESAAKKQERIDSGRDIVVGVKKYWINEDDGNNGDGNGDGNEGGGGRVICP